MWRVGCRHCARRAAPGRRRGLAALSFPGQGVQTVGMLDAWEREFPVVRETVEQVSSVLDRDIGKLIREGPHDELVKTENAQPAILTSSWAMLRALEAEGLKLQEHIGWTLGHSLGEFNSLMVSGILAWQDGVRIVERRAAAMAQPVVGGRHLDGQTMYAVIVPADRMNTILRRIDYFCEVYLQKGETMAVANYNSATQIVLSGNTKAIRRFLGYVRDFDGADPRAVPLPVSAPFHTRIMEPARQAIAAMLADADAIPLYSPLMPVIANVTALPYPDPEKSVAADAECRSLISEQCTLPVRWMQSVHFLRRVHNVHRWVAVGPGRTTANLIARETGDSVACVAQPKDIRPALEYLAK